MVNLKNQKSQNLQGSFVPLTVSCTMLMLTCKNLQFSAKKQNKTVADEKVTSSARD